VLWTYAGDLKLYATTTLPWPRTGVAPFDVAFTTTAPQGAAPTLTELSGEVYDATATRLDPGTRIEASVADTLCGIATIRDTDFYILAVVGPDSIPACTAGAPITFTINGTPANETAPNSPDHSTHLDLTL
jgi:hypothetical protein